MIENIKRKFPPITSMRERQLLQDPGYRDTVDTCCMLHAMRQGAILIVFTMYVDTADTIELQCRFSFKVFELGQNSN